MKKVLITGVAGFIGSSLSDMLLKKGKYHVIGVDNFDDYYDKSIKVANLNSAFNNTNFTFFDNPRFAFSR